MHAIQFVSHANIDKVKWNSCIHYATNGSIFGYWWYLRNTVKEWDALIEIDPENGYYESVLPLIKPLVANEQGAVWHPLSEPARIFSIHLLSTARIEAFLAHIPEAYRQQSLLLHDMPDARIGNSHKLSSIPKHLLLLQDSYEQLSAHYSPTLSSQIDQALAKGLLPHNGLKPEHLAEFYQTHSRADQNTTEQFHAYQRIMYNALHRGWGFASGIVNAAQELVACCFFLYSHGRIYSMLPVANAEGLEKQALALLLDLLIRSQAGKPVLLDFNTALSDWPKGLPAAFGAQEEVGWQLWKD